MNKFLTFGFLTFLLTAICLGFVYFNAYDGVYLLLVIAAVSSMIAIFIQDAEQSPDTFSHFKNMV